MMPSLNRKTLFLILIFTLPGCAIKGYVGVDLPDEQLATVQLKAPTIASIPILNLLAEKIDNDWYQTSSMDEIQANKIELTRFNKILLKPGNINFHAKKRHYLDEKKIADTDRTSSGSCNCTETVDKDKQITKTCQRTVTTTWDAVVTAKDELCQMDYQVQANKSYELFIRKGELILQDEGLNALKKSLCQTGASFKYSSTASSSENHSCWCAGISCD